MGYNKIPHNHQDKVERQIVFHGSKGLYVCIFPAGFIHFTVNSNRFAGFKYFVNRLLPNSYIFSFCALTMKNKQKVIVIVRYNLVLNIWQTN